MSSLYILEVTCTSRKRYLHLHAFGTRQFHTIAVFTYIMHMFIFYRISSHNSLFVRVSPCVFHTAIFVVELLAEVRPGRACESLYYRGHRVTSRLDLFLSHTLGNVLCLFSNIFQGKFCGLQPVPSSEPVVKLGL